MWKELAYAFILATSACQPRFDPRVATREALVAQLAAARFQETPTPLPQELEIALSQIKQISMEIQSDVGECTITLLKLADDIGMAVGSEHCFFFEDTAVRPSMFTIKNHYTGGSISLTNFKVARSPGNYQLAGLAFRLSQNNIAGQDLDLPPVEVVEGAQKYPIGSTFVVYGYGNEFQKAGFTAGHLEKARISEVVVHESGSFYYVAEGAVLGSNDSGAAGFNVDSGGTIRIGGILYGGEVNKSIFIPLTGFTTLKQTLLSALQLP